MNELDRVHENLSDHDLLLMSVTKLIGLEKQFSNHLAHHQNREMVYLTVTMGSILTAVISVVCVVMTFFR